MDELLLEKIKMALLYYVIIALPCTVGAIALAIFHIYRHLVNYTEPTFQRYIVRIIFMVPVSAPFLSNFGAICFCCGRRLFVDLFILIL